MNDCLEIENSAYRVINYQITPITSEQEIQSIEDALENTHPYTGIQQHLNQALKLMSDRQKPDYRNSIKESISAVESICKIVTDDEKATLGQALKIIESKYGLHEALKKSLSQLYGYTSDADGIRHAMLEESNLSYIDAKFMLVARTNFINYLIENITIERALKIAEKIRCEIYEAKPVDVERCSNLRVSVSVGVAIGANSWMELLEKADRALFQAKEQGKNKVAS